MKSILKPSGTALALLVPSVLFAGAARADYNIPPGHSATLTTSYNGNVNVGAGATFTLSGGAVVSGNVQADAQSSVTIDGATVKGNVQTNGAASLVITGGTVGGNVQPQGTASVTISGSAIQGNLQPQKGGAVTVLCSSINGNLEAQQGGAVNVTGDTVKGNVQVQSNTGSVSIIDGTIGNNLQIQQNAGAVTATGSAVQGNVQVQHNTGGPTTVSGNSAKQLQCDGNANLVTCTGVPQVAQTSGSLCSAKTVGGTLSGLLAGSITLADNGSDNLTVSANGAFTFASPVAYLSGYSVAITAQPEGQTCTVANGSGTMGASAITSVAVTCVPNDYQIGGTVSGLISGILVIQDSHGDTLFLNSSSPFDFSNLAAFDSTYGVSVVSQPAGQTCTVTNGSGTVGAGNVGSISIACAPNQYSVGGTVSGLTTGPLVLTDNAGDNLSVTSNGPFTMPSSYAFASQYAVGAGSQPPGQTCTVAQGGGAVGAGAVTTIAVTCTPNLYSIGGTINGLAPGGSVDINYNGFDDLGAYANGGFTFDMPGAYGSSYHVELDFVSPGQTCTVAHSSGQVVAGAVTDIAVTCVLNDYSVGGTVAGLLAGSLVLDNGTDSRTLAGNGPFSFGTDLPYLSSYAVTIAAQPIDQTCTLANDSGIVGANNVTSVAATCVPNLPGAPTNVQAAPGSGSANVTWTPPADTLAIGFCTVTWYLGGIAQGSLDASGNSAQVSGLVNGQSYTFAVSCTNPTGTGPVSTPSAPAEASACLGAVPVVCGAVDACHLAGVCDAATGVCSNPAASDGTSCNDGNACTQTDVCIAGACTGANPIVCAASDQCHAAGACNPSNGQCSNPALANGTACDDGNACTQSDTCHNGACTGANPIVCTASDQCHVAGACNPSNGQCSNPAAPNGTACNDGNACTQTDVCQSGACVGENPVICAPSDSCHFAGSCNPANGSCTNPVAPNGTVCGASLVCESAICSGVPDAPGAPSASAGNGSVTVSWIAPADNGTPITSYTVTPFLNGVAQAPVTVISTSTTIAGLTNNKTYTFTVYATNVVGNGPASAASTPATPEPTCAPGQTLCGGTCDELANDPDNCGACGNVCSNGQVCQAGVCAKSFATSPIAAGAVHVCVLRPSGKVYCWGDNTNGQLGQGTTGGSSSTPLLVGSLSGVIGLTAAPYNTCALLQSGGVKCWGRNNTGQLGIGNTADTGTPTSVLGIGGSGTLTGATAVSGSFTNGATAHTCAVLSSGQVACWGDNEFGELGNGSLSAAPQTSPVLVSNIGNAVTVATSYNSSLQNYSCALLANGTVSCWGAPDGQRTSTVSTPSPITGITNGVGLAPILGGLCVVSSDQTVLCWGSNTNDNLGDGSTSPSTVPRAVLGLSNATAISGMAGTTYTSACAAQVTGGVVCWGEGGDGELGNNTTNNSDVPVAVHGINNVGLLNNAVNTAIGGGAGSGQATGCSILSTNDVACWGSNGFGELGNGTTNTSLFPVLVQTPPGGW